MDDKLYVWIIEDDAVYPCTGDLDKYARDWESSHYTGLGVSRYVWSFTTGEPVRHQVAVHDDGKGFDDYLYYHLVVDGETVHVRVDGRA